MTGYHYTPEENVSSILEFGLVPYPCHREELAEYDLPTDFMGMWIWAHALSEIDEFGSLVYVLARHQSTRIAKLQIEYHDSERLTFRVKEKDYGISLPHNGTIGEYEFHPGSPVGHILNKLIEPEHIKLLKVFDLTDIVKERNEHAKISKSK